MILSLPFSKVASSLSRWWEAYGKLDVSSDIPPLTNEFSADFPVLITDRDFPLTRRLGAFEILNEGSSHYPQYYAIFDDLSSEWGPTKVKISETLLEQLMKSPEDAGPNAHVVKAAIGKIDRCDMYFLAELHETMTPDQRSEHAMERRRRDI